MGHPRHRDTTASHTISRHLCIDPTGRVIYVDYPLPLSPTEVRILQCLLAAIEVSFDTYVAKETLIASLAEEVASMDGAPSSPAAPCMTAGQLTVHIARINRKARAIGGRELILCKRHHGYRLNPFL